MVKRHLKRYSAPKFWKIKPKEKTYVVRPRPGPHKLFECIPLQVLIRDVLGLVDTGSEIRKLVKMGEIHVDGRPRKDYKYPAGLMDVVSIPKMKEDYRIIIDSKGLKVIKCPKKEANTKLVRINGKTLIKGGKLQLNLSDGRTMIIPVKNPKKPKEDVYKTGDSLLIELPSQKILEHIKLEKGNMVLMIGGQNIGMFAKVKETITTRSREPNKVLCEVDGKEVEAIKDYVFVVGKKKPVIKLDGE